MKSALDLHDSRLDWVELSGDEAIVHFSHAYIHKSKGTPGQDPGTAWSQEAILVLAGGHALKPLPPLPAAISDGYLEVGGIRHSLLPLPFARKVPVALTLTLAGETTLELAGRSAAVELLGQAIYLEEFP